MTYSLLRSRASFGKFCYFIRTISSDCIKETTESFDQNIRQCFITVFLALNKSGINATLVLNMEEFRSQKCFKHSSATYIPSFTTNYETITNVIDHQEHSKNLLLQTTNNLGVQVLQSCFYLNGFKSTAKHYFVQ